jgi:hypothetical protein
MSMCMADVAILLEASSIDHRCCHCRCCALDHSGDRSAGA